jgi:hypothetical protein
VPAGARGQVAAAAYYDVPPAVARRLYRDTRGALTPDPPAVESCSCCWRRQGGPVPVRAYRPKGAGKDEVLPALSTSTAAAG